MIATNKYWGKFLYRFAWFIEIVAVLIGIFFAVSTLIMSYRGVGIDNRDANLTVNAFMGALPWLAAAIAELTKIPLAIGFYRSPKRAWKAGFAFGLLLLIVITWETMFGGLERNFTVQTDKLSQIEAQIDAFEDNIKFNNSEIERLQKITSATITNDYTTERQIINNDRTSNLSRIDDSYSNRINQVSEQIDLLMQGQTTQYISRKETDLENLKAQLKNELEDRENRINQKYDSKKQIIEDDIRSMENRAKEEADGLPENTRRIKMKRREIGEAWNNRIEVKRLELLDLEDQKNTEIENNINNYKESFTNTKIVPLQEELEAERFSLFEQSDNDAQVKKLENDRLLLIDNRVTDIEKINTTADFNIATITTQRDNALTELKNTSDKIARYQDENNLKRSEIIKKREDTRAERLEIQVYRFTLIFMNIFPDLFSEELPSDDVSPKNETVIFDIADVDARTAQIVAFAWFGGIAFVIATIGIALAIGSEVLLDMNSLVEKDKTRQQKKIIDYFKEILKSFINILLSLVKLFRGTTAAVWRRLRKPRIKTLTVYEDREIEVPIEVPVEKIVEKEIPKEVVKWKTRIVQIPLYSTQPGMVELGPDFIKTNIPEQKIDKDDSSSDKSSTNTEFVPVSAHTVLNTINLDDGKVVEVRAGQWGGYYLKLGNLTKSVGRGISPKDIDEDLVKEILKEELQILKNNEKEKNINESSVEDNIEDKDDESNS